MNKMQQNRKAYKSRITGRIALQYFLSLGGYVVGLLLLVYLAWRLCANTTWLPYDPLYNILDFIRDYLWFFIAFFLLAGWALITYHFMGVPLRYLDDVISASELLASPSDDQIILPEALKAVQDELNEVRETALHNARLAKEAEQRKNDLVVYLAHDLKTPLSSVIGYLNLLVDEPQISDHLRQKYLAISLNKAERLEDLINEFFEIARFNLTNITLQYSKISLTRLLEQLVSECEPMLKGKNLSCSLNMPQEEVWIKCDADKIQRVFDNLLRNAMIYSFKDTDIQISLAVRRELAEIQFMNHGNTIPAEKLERIFEQFYRLDAARGSSGGSGLGLAIAKRIVELHGGKISAESSEARIRFIVTFLFRRKIVGILSEKPQNTLGKKIKKASLFSIQ